MNTRRSRIPIVYILLIASVIIMLLFREQAPAEEEVLTINQLAADIQAEKVEKISIEEENKLYVLYNNDKEREVMIEDGATLIDQLLALGVDQAKLSSDTVEIEVIEKEPSGVFVHYCERGRSHDPTDTDCGRNTLRERGFAASECTGKQYDLSARKRLPEGISVVHGLFEASGYHGGMHHVAPEFSS